MARPRVYPLNDSAREVRALMQVAGLDEAGASDFLGVNERTMSRYHNGHTIPEPVLRLLRVAARFDVEAEDLEREPRKP